MVEVTGEKHGITRHFSGHVTAEEMAQSAIRAQADERFDSIRWVIQDFTDCVSIDVSVDELKVMMSTAGAATYRVHGRTFQAVFVGKMPLLRSMVEDPNNLLLFGHSLTWLDTLAEARAFLLRSKEGLQSPGKSEW